MKETYYFSHDYNARSDIKIKKLIAKHGYNGYGLYWALIEDLYQNANALPLDYDSIAHDLRSSADIIESIIIDCELFVFNEGNFGSLSVQRRLDERDKKSVKARESALYRWAKIEKNANALHSQSDSNAIKERKGKEKKRKEIKEIKENIYKQFAHLKLSILDYEKLIEAGYSKIEIDDILLKIENYRNNTTYKSLYLTSLNWLKQKTPVSTNKSHFIKILNDSDY